MLRLKINKSIKENVMNNSGMPFKTNIDVVDAMCAMESV